MRFVPAQLDGLRVATVADPVAVSRAWALQLLTDAAAAGPPKVLRHGADARPPPEVQRGDLPVGAVGSLQSPRGGAGHRRRRSGPGRPRGPAAPGGPPPFRPPEQPGGRFSERILKGRPQALVEAVEILIRRPEAVRAVLTRFGYTDPDTIGGYLDRDLPVLIQRSGRW